MSKWSNIRIKMMFTALNFNMICIRKYVTNWQLIAIYFVMIQHTINIWIQQSGILSIESSNLLLRGAATSGRGQVFETPILFVYCFTMSVAEGSRSRDNWWSGGEVDILIHLPSSCFSSGLLLDTKMLFNVIAIDSSLKGVSVLYSHRDKIWYSALLTEWNT